MRSPVLLLIFNRPALTGTALACIRQARPPRLYIAADGPRKDRDGEAALCKEAREAATRVDWPCEVLTLFRDANMGGPRAIPEAINWFFSREEEGVILEDDIVAHADFFAFCDALLEKYRHHPNIMHITGNNFQLGLRHGDASYFFSKIPHTWGWATWARAWKQFKPVISRAEIEAFIKHTLLAIAPAGELGYVPEMMRRCAGDAVGHWDARWWYAVAAHDGLVPTPNMPLTRNIGYGEDATHTRRKTLLHCIPLSPSGALRHPEEMQWTKRADEVDYRIVFSGALNTPQGFAKELRRRLEHGDPPDGIACLEKIGRKYFAENA